MQVPDGCWVTMCQISRLAEIKKACSWRNETTVDIDIEFVFSQPDSYLTTAFVSFSLAAERSAYPHASQQLPRLFEMISKRGSTENRLDHQRFSRIKQPAVVEWADLGKRHLEKFASTCLPEWNFQDKLTATSRHSETAGELLCCVYRKLLLPDSAPSCALTSYTAREIDIGTWRCESNLDRTKHFKFSEPLRVRQKERSGQSEQHISDFDPLNSISSMSNVTARGNSTQGTETSSYARVSSLALLCLLKCRVQNLFLLRFLNTNKRNTPTFRSKCNPVIQSTMTRPSSKVQLMHSSLLCRGKVWLISDIHIIARQCQLYHGFKLYGFILSRLKSSLWKLRSDIFTLPTCRSTSVQGWFGLTRAIHRPIISQDIYAINCWTKYRQGCFADRN